MARREYKRQPKEYEERIIQIKRVSKKTKGGNKIGFTALVVVGNRKGKVGFGLGKAGTVADAIKKGIKKATDSIVEIPLTKNTIPHEVEHKFKSAHVLLKPAPVGSGIIAGGSIRDVVQMVGLSDISAKMLGSNNKNNNLRCTIEALQELKLEGTKNDSK